MINDVLKQPLIHRLLAFADDLLILSHRNAEWVGHAPILEEDIALANVAQDELGHAILFYAMLTSLTGITGDEYAMQRETADFRNIQMAELPKGDWAFTILRQYLFDAYQNVLYTRLMSSQYQPLADAAAKMIKEEMYHLRHTHAWVERLGLGTEESNQRMQAALTTLWPYTAQFFIPLTEDNALITAHIIPNISELSDSWWQIVAPHLTQSGLHIPQETLFITTGRDQHTHHLRPLLNDLQQLARREPNALW